MIFLTTFWSKTNNMTVYDNFSQAAISSFKIDINYCLFSGAK